MEMVDILIQSQTFEADRAYSMPRVLIGSEKQLLPKINVEYYFLYQENVQRLKYRDTR